MCCYVLESSDQYAGSQEGGGEESTGKADFGNNNCCKPTTLSVLYIWVNPVNLEHSEEEINWVIKNIQAATQPESKSPCLRTTEA